MFGGHAFIVSGHMACVVHESALMVRIDRTSYDSLISQEHVGPLSMTQRKIKTFVEVATIGLTGSRLHTWVEHGLGTVAALPAKGRPKKKKTT